MCDLLPRVDAYVRQRGLFTAGETVVAGVSGGPDSVCLLHLLTRLAGRMPGLRLHAAHLNHQLRGAEADADAAFVADLAARWGVPYTVGRADVAALAERAGLSLEEAARQARYAFLADVARTAGAGVIATGHNADDQAETVLMHLLRGSGVAGLRGMLPVTGLSEYRLAGYADLAQSGHPLRLVRPLLEIPRADILAYCEHEGLAFRFDRSNEDTTFYRNRLRHELLPVLETYNPAIRIVLARTAEVLAGDYEVLAAELARAWARVTRPAAPGEVQFDRPAWVSLPVGLQRALVREAVHRLRSHLRNINWEHIERAVRMGREGRPGQAATLAAGLELQVGADWLRIAAEGTLPAAGAGLPQIAGPVALAAPGVTPLGGGWQVTVAGLARAELPGDYSENTDPWAAWLDADAVGPAPALRPREPGDRLQPQGMAGHSVRLNELMINLKAPRSARAGWPVLVGRSGIAWACGLRVDERAAIGPQTAAAWHVTFERAARAGEQD